MDDIARKKCTKHFKVEFYIQGKAPDVMCRYYMDRGLFNEAMKFALKNCPQYVDDIRHLMSKQSDLEVNSNTINNLTGKELIQRAELKISSQEYQAAIQLLLCIDSNKIADSISFRLLYLNSFRISLYLEFHPEIIISLKLV